MTKSLVVVFAAILIWWFPKALILDPLCTCLFAIIVFIITIPIFKDAKVLTPMDACLDKENNIFNLKLVSVLFKKTMDYPLLHSSHLMQSAICKGIENSVPEVREYLSHRWIDIP